MNPRLLSQFPLTLVDTPCVVVIYHFFLFCPNIAFTFWIFINVFTSSSFFWPWIEGFHPLFRFPSCSQCSDIRLFTKTVHCYTLQVHCTFWYSVLSSRFLHVCDVLISDSLLKLSTVTLCRYTVHSGTLYSLVALLTVHSGTLSLQLPCTIWYSVLSLCRYTVHSGTLYSLVALLTCCCTITISSDTISPRTVSFSIPLNQVGFSSLQILAFN